MKENHRNQIVLLNTKEQVITPTRKGGHDWPKVPHFVEHPLYIGHRSKYLTDTNTFKSYHAYRGVGTIPVHNLPKSDGYKI